MMSSSRSKYEHMLTAGLPILIAIVGGTLAIISGPIRENDTLSLVIFMTYFIGQCGGLVLIFLSKFSNIKKGIYFNFGFAGMEKRERFLYVLGYTILIMTTVHEIIYAFRQGLL